MKRELSQEELIERWTLAPNELLLLMNKSGPGRLGFAAMLKFFQADGRFPAGKRDVPVEAIRCLVQQTKTVPSMWADYDWQGRTIKYHRAEIRSLFDFREATTDDSESVMMFRSARAVQIIRYTPIAPYSARNQFCSQLWHRLRETDIAVA